MCPCADGLERAADRAREDGNADCAAMFEDMLRDHERECPECAQPVTVEIAGMTREVREK